MSQPPQGPGNWGGPPSGGQNPFGPNGGGQPPQGGQPFGGQGGQPYGGQPQQPYGGQGGQPYGGPQQPFGGDPMPPAGPGGAAGAATKKAGLSTLAKSLIAVGAIAVVGAGAGVAIADPFGFRSADTAMAKVVPGDATVYANINLEPSAAQQGEMLRFAAKFPSLRENFNLSESTDLRKTIFDDYLEDNPCPTVTYEADIEPWLGTQAGFALRPGTEEPLAFLEADDEQQARAAIAKLSACNNISTDGVAYTSGHLILAGTQEEAEQTIVDAEAGSLKDNEVFQEDFAKLGASGVATMWATAEGVQQLAELSGNNQAVPTNTAAVRSMAVTLRFTGGNPELYGVVKSNEELNSAGPTTVGDLPAESTVAFGVAGGKQSVPDIMEALQQSGMDPYTLSQQTGLQFPQDLETLLGDDFVFSAGKVDLEAVDPTNPATMPFGLSLTTDQAALSDLVTKIEQLGLKLTQIDNGDMAYVSLSPAYAQSLGNPAAQLKDDADFKAAVADAGKAQAVAFFDIAAYQAELSAQMPEADRRDFEVLRAVGMSASTMDDNYGNFAVRVTAN